MFDSLPLVGAREQLRWQIVDETPGGPAQLSMFEEPVGREIGTGEFRGLEFLRVRARSIINEVGPKSPVPFRYTINAYRGCSHACSYCAEGRTAVLMADGRTKPLADVEPGDAVYGTARDAAGRNLVTTTVLDQWSIVKPAHEVQLADGTQLITSVDHRFLTRQGWRHVSRLMPGDRIVGVDRRPIAVASVSDLGIEIPMYDITTGTGDFIANGVVSHNCFARPTHEYLGLDPGEDFDRVIVVKVNAVERLRAELAPKRWAGDHIAMGTNTDPYQRAEGKFRLTRGIVEVLTEAGNPFSILTKNTLVLRDLDLLAEAARRAPVQVNFSIGTLDDEVWRASEPGTPHPRKRIEAVARLNDAGVPCGVLVAPVLPGLSDGREQLDDVVGACVAAGATSISSVLLHLRPGVREHYLAWLEGYRPDLLEQHVRLYRGSYAPPPERARISQLVEELVREHRRMQGAS
jgi:DNA repair photolyase